MSVIERMVRHPIAVALSLLFAAFIIANAVLFVPETAQGVVLRLGEPIGTINRYRNGEQFGRSDAGLYVIAPVLDQVIWIDKRVRDVEMQRQLVLSNDQQRLNVDAFARFRIVDPLRMYSAAKTENRVTDSLAPILGSVLRNELGKRKFAELLSPERSQIMENIRRALDIKARQYGAQIVDVRIKKTNPPEGPPLDSAFERMKSAREQEALTLQAEGYKQAQIIRAEADANAAGIYATAYGKDPKFYDFYRAMQSYRHTFGADGSKPEGQSSIVLSPGNDYLREFRGGR